MKRPAARAYAEYLNEIHSYICAEQHPDINLAILEETPIYDTLREEHDEQADA